MAGTRKSSINSTRKSKNGKQGDKNGQSKTSKKAIIAEDNLEILPAEEPLNEDLALVKDQAIEVLPLGQAEILEEDLETESARQPVKKSKTSLAPYNAQTAYLQEIRRHPPLSIEEEKSLALSYRQNKDLDAAKKLTLGNLWLVVKIARDYERAARSLLDLIQEGNIGLMEAVKNFDPYKGTRFPSYAAWWIKAYMIRFIIANWRLVKIGTTQAQRKLFFNLNKEKEKLERLGFYPSPKLLAEKLDVRESDVVEMEQRLSGGDVSVDAPTNEDSDANLLSVLPTKELSAEDELANKQRKAQIKAVLQSFVAELNDKEKEIFSKRLLVEDEDKAILQDLSDQLGISKERVRQIENRIKEKLKIFLTEHFKEGLPT